MQRNQVATGPDRRSNSTGHVIALLAALVLIASPVAMGSATRAPMLTVDQPTITDSTSILLAGTRTEPCHRVI
jgi:hypothetical protein